MTEPLSGLSSLADRYDAVLCDVWGVLHNGREAFPGPCEALARFGAECGPVVLISNAPRPAAAVYDQLRELGVPDSAWSGFVTSGDATSALLAARAPGPVFALGPDRDLPLYDELGLTLSPLADAAFICCTGLFDDEVETAEDYRASMTTAVARDLEFICANPDLVVQRGDQLVVCAGAIAALYAQLGGRVLMAGKPYAPVYDLALAEVDRLAGRPVDRRRILAIGDGVGTDVTGANRQGLDCLFITDGIHAAEAADAVLAKAGAHAAYAMAGLSW
jgi:HAD superfamily hydrolase (TIGR01459 family)